jgi:hypothetical protein
MDDFDEAPRFEDDDFGDRDLADEMGFDVLPPISSSRGMAAAAVRESGREGKSNSRLHLEAGSSSSKMVASYGKEDCVSLPSRAESRPRTDYSGLSGFGGLLVVCV